MVYTLERPRTAIANTYTPPNPKPLLPDLQPKPQPTPSPTEETSEPNPTEETSDRRNIRT